MDHRKSLLKNAIRRALLPTRRQLLIGLVLLAAQPMTPLLAADTQTEWSCKPNANGAGWNCQEYNIEGQAVPMPQHAVTTTPNATGKQTSDHNQSLAAPGKAAAISSQKRVSAARTDWRPVAELTAEQQENVSAACCGSYIEPQRTDAEADLNAEEAPLRATADSSELLQETNAVLTGNIKVIQGKRLLEADKATIDQTTDRATLEGNVLLREPGVLMTGSRAEMDVNTGHAVLSDASFLLHSSQVRGEANRLEHQTNNVIVLDDSTFTRCEPDDNSWHLKGSKFTIDPNTQQGVGKHVRVHIKDVPVFYTPYIRFPLGNERQSGFLFPSFGFSDSNGVDITTPYYLNLAPNYDMTIAPRYIAERGTMLETEARHLSSNFETEVNVALLSSDDGGSRDDDQLGKTDVNGNLITQDTINRYDGEDRWLFGLDQIGGRNERWFTQVDYTSVSDIDYFRDLGTASLAVNSATHLRKSGAAGYRFDNWSLAVKAEEFQTLAENTETPYQQLPRINLDGEYRFGDWLVELDNEVVDFDHRNEFWNNSTEPRITGTRGYTDYSLSWDKRWLWGFVKPSVATKSLFYNLDSNGLSDDTDNSFSITVPQGSLDMGLIFERDGSLFGDNYTQTFEPRLFYFYSDYQSHDKLYNLTGSNDQRSNINFDTSELTYSYSQLFRDTRFSGHDRIDDANRLSVGLTTRFIETDTGIERLSASIGQIYHYDDRVVNLLSPTQIQASSALDNTTKNSELAAQLAVRIGDYWTAGVDVIWDEDNNDKVERGSASLRYMDDQYRILNLSYRYSRRPSVGEQDFNDIDNDGDTTEFINDVTVDQSDISLILPITADWSFIGRNYYDFTYQRELETLFGVEYNSCCYRTRIVARRWLDNDLANIVIDEDLEYDRGIFFELQLKGLGGIGNKVSKILSEGILGYDERELNQQ